MNERIKELAELAGLAEAADVRGGYIYPEGMTKFATLVAAHEREACAQIVEANAAVCANNLMLADVLAGNAAAIRARGGRCS